MIFADTTTIDPLQLLLVNAGVSGVVVVLILVGWLWAKPSVIREFEKADIQHAQDKALVDTMLAVYHQEVLPTLADVDRRLIPLLESTSHLMQRVEGLLDRMEREWEWRERRGRAYEEAPRDDRFRGAYDDRRRSGGGEGSGAGDHPTSEGRPG